MSAKFWWTTVNVICKIGGIMNGKILPQNSSENVKGIDLLRQSRKKHWVKFLQKKKSEQKVQMPSWSSWPSSTCCSWWWVWFALHHHLHWRRKLDSALILYDGCKAASLQGPLDLNIDVWVCRTFKIFSSNWKFST